MPPIDVLCIGDLDVDMFVSVPEIPGFDQKTTGIHHGQMPGGMAANCAVALARLGLKSRLISAVGDDEPGRFAMDRIGADGVDLQFLAYKPGVGTFMCLILLSPSGEKSLIRLETGAYLPSVEDLVSEAFDDVGHLHMTFGSAELTRAALQMATERSITTSLDLEPPDIRRSPGQLIDVLPLVDTLFLNREAHDLLTSVLGSLPTPAHLRAGGEIVVTLGADGSRWTGSDGSAKAHGFSVTALDTTGAGDCFAAAYLTAKLRGVAPEARLRFANTAAAMATRGIGAQATMPREAEVEAFVQEFEPAGRERGVSHG